MVGAGPIGLEFASMLAQFGSRVTLINRGTRLLAGHDEQLANEIEERLAQLGVTTLHEAQVTAASERADGLDLVLGAQLWAVDAQELVNLVALAMRAGVTASELRDGIWTHPSTTEALNEVLAELS